MKLGFLEYIMDKLIHCGAMPNMLGFFGSGQGNSDG
jgi:hypothetical protein